MLSFLVTLVIPVLGYLLCYLVVPDLDAEEVDLRAMFHANRGWFFGLVAVASGFSFVADWMGSGIYYNMNAAFRLVFVVSALAAMRVDREWYQVAYAVFGLVFFTTFVFAEFFKLA